MSTKHLEKLCITFGEFCAHITKLFFFSGQVTASSIDYLESSSMVIGEILFANMH